MTDRYLKLPLTFDTARLHADLKRLQPHNWLQHINQRAHNGGWRALPLRSVDGCLETIAVSNMDQTRYADTCYLTACDYLPDVLAQLKCPLHSARLMSLAAGEEIKRHTDNALSFKDGCARLHIPMQTHPDVTFTIDDHTVHFGQGECWYMNANYPHQVSNDSPLDRIHLVVDCTVNAWLSDLFHAAGYQEAAEHYKYGDPSITDENAPQVIAQLETMDTPAGIAIAQRIRSIWQSNRHR
ncbi:aspartyl/asparaginyl beta-hydroxylase domain-containing protein [Marinobacterium arenosum]|uniref:aspartyl/asparaginyl beta-hydroxylase domain-containing protein n=1 Tax=Marinobacterium arenosum TaxID=2862496 RepID=UPI001C96A964|nr:aspartyl/asparaginyl beta-hydroxylase domain-containing protein [Marinobacterium arenosum]MBY4678832.1 aspartyl/asparaginyl beta-hydroxylase domain-containing protein [Marinobacterium arenosum]